MQSGEVNGREIHGVFLNSEVPHSAQEVPVNKWLEAWKVRREASCMLALFSKQGKNSCFWPLAVKRMR